MNSVPKHILPVIVFAQFAGTSLWFAGNAIVADIQLALQLESNALGSMTSAVQFGFIVGTLVFAVLSLSDRFSPSKVFLFSALTGALFNSSVYWLSDSLFSVLVLRFLTGFFLAGIYPVGMKIAADWFQKDLGKALGYLVGALVLGTAFPHILKALAGDFSWGAILLFTSALAASGGLLLFYSVGDGPGRKPAPAFRWDAITKIFHYRDFRSAAFGYFGHMWELYAMWAFVPFMLSSYNMMHGAAIPVSLWSFIVIGTGSLGCIFGGYLSLHKGSNKVALLMLSGSGIFCLFSPLLFQLPDWLFLAGLIVWGILVIGDSAQFSTLVAKTAPPDYVGTALTIVNCIGFTLTIFSVQLLVQFAEAIDPAWLYWLLLPGPIFGLFHISRLWNKSF